ncbi:fimbrial biogenesis outer membrane usher protein [Ewingella americana]|uniref:Fimbrial biogenesis outer membrane usher protein n=1 Tax=Ewingella americana TaxID=41202 RepID=A0A502GB33_9GAMM|nr:fimbrial biogenesis outer membrane usher protein [Ewingella americana]
MRTFIVLTAFFSLSSFAGESITPPANKDTEFDADFLRKDTQEIPQQFYHPNAISAGIKNVDIVLNGKALFKTKINFITGNDSQNATPCLTMALLHQMGLDQHLNKSGTSGNEACYDLLAKWPDGTIKYDEAMQQLNITAPQAATNVASQREMIDPSLWDRGVNALRMSYSGYVYHTDSHDNRDGDSESSDTAYLSLNSGVNLGNWRFYSFDTFNKSQQGWEQNHDRAYAERDIAALVSRFTVGDVYASTSSDVLGILPIRGMTLETNNQMLPSDTFSYSPVIRGVARSNARVVIRQRGNIIYSKTVPPGNFAISDLNNGQIGADLDVTVEESDGSKQQFTVPYTSLPNMLRPGTWRYSLSAGRYRDDGLAYQPLVAQGSLQYGWEKLTLNDLVVAGEGYHSMALGGAFNLGSLGSISLDWALEKHQSASGMRVEDEQAAAGTSGRALRLLYARRFDTTDTSLQLMGYRYQSRDFLDFPEYASAMWGNDDTQHHRKNEFQATLNQGLGDFGNGYLTLQRDNYYDESASNTSLTMGYSFNIKAVNVGISYSYQANSDDGSDSAPDRQLSLNFSVPLDMGDRRSRNLSFSTNSGNHSSGSQMATVSGTELDNAMNYSLSAQHDSNGYSPSASVTYRNSMANMNASASVTQDSRQYSAGISGGVVAYNHGVVLSQQLGDTIAIIETPGAQNISVEGQPGVSTNRWGRAVVPSISAYRDNSLSLDTRHAADNIELTEGGSNVIPSHGAVVVRRFQTKVGRRALVGLSLANGKPAPFGATVRQGEEQVGMVADNGLLYLSGVLAEGETTLHVTLENNSQCQFTLPVAKGLSDPWYQQINAVCR